LAATTEIPIKHPKVVDLAKQAVSGANVTAEKVARVVRFVHRYIDDELSVGPLTLLDVILPDAKAIALNTRHDLPHWLEHWKFPAARWPDWCMPGIL